MNASLTSALRHLRRVVVRHSASRLSDAELLQRFAAQRDQAAFEVLVWRHGPMVLNVAERVLHSLDDAEDVLQATFLALVRQAHSMRRGGALAGWLYQVAYRTALRARAQRARRPVGRVPVEDVPAPPSPGHDPGRDVLAVLDEELHRLPDKYRTPLVLSYLQGLTNREIAYRLGCPPGTVFTRLARGRDLLRKRLTRRGVAVSAGLLGAALLHATAAPALRAELVQTTLKAAALFAVVPGAAAGVVSPNVAALTEGALQMIGPGRLRVVWAVLVLLAVAGAGAGLLVLRGAARENESASPRPEGAGGPAEAPRPPKEALRYGGKSFDEWRTLLQTELKPETRVEGVKALCAFGANGYGREAAVAVVTAVRGYNPDVVDPGEEAVLAAARLGLAKIGAEAVPVLVDELKTGGRNGRRFALHALRVMGRQGEPAAPAVAEALKDRDPGIRLWAAEALGPIDPEASTVSAVAEAVTDEDVRVRSQALTLLAGWKGKARAATPQLLAGAVKDDDPDCRRVAMDALGAIKPPAKDLVPTLAEAVKDKNPYVRGQAFGLLNWLGPEAREGVPALVGEFQRAEDEPGKRLGIVQVLGNMGPAAKAAVPALIESLKREAPGSTTGAAVREALKKINP
jgi:RNA polymerase sigma factor (sigma-70 family)